LEDLGFLSVCEGFPGLRIAGYLDRRPLFQLILSAITQSIDNAFHVAIKNGGILSPPGPQSERGRTPPDSRSDEGSVWKLFECFFLFFFSLVHLYSPPDDVEE